MMINKTMCKAKCSLWDVSEGEYTYVVHKERTYVMRGGKQKVM